MLSFIFFYYFINSIFQCYYYFFNSHLSFSEILGRNTKHYLSPFSFFSFGHFLTIKSFWLVACFSVLNNHPLAFTCTEDTLAGDSHIFGKYFLWIQNSRWIHFLSPLLSLLCSSGTIISDKKSKMAGIVSYVEWVISLPAHFKIF